MATLVLGTVGRIFGGPLGGIIGTALGGVVDRGLFGGGGKPREVGRIGNIAVQSAAYGEPIPFVAGRMRAAGNLLWTSGITETATRTFRSVVEALAYFEAQGMFGEKNLFGN